MGRGRIGFLALALVLVLASPSVVAQSTAAWDELAGGAGRTGAAFLPSARLDVLESRDLFGDGMALALHYSKGVVSTPHGLLALAQRERECVLLTVGAEGVAERALEGCAGGTLTAYDRVRDRLLVCSEGGPQDPVFQARDAATGALAWGIAPAQVGVAPEGPVRWDCRGTALSAREDVAYVAMWRGEGAGAVDARILRVRLDTGAVDWDRTIASAHFYAPAVNGLDVDPPGAHFTPFGLSLAESGLVVSGRTACACGKGDPLGPLATGAATAQGAVAWLDMEDGDVVGSALAEEDPDAVADGFGGRVYGQWWATTQGPLAAFALGGRVLVVNPAEEEPVREAPFEGIETGRGYFGIIPSAWWEDVLLVPMAKSLTALDSGSLATRWSKAFGDEWVVSGLLVLPPSDVLVLVASNRDGNGDTEAVLHRLDLATGRELQRIPLPGTVLMTGGTGRVAFHPLDDGRLLVLSLDGRLVTLGPAPDALLPRLALSHEYPAPGDLVSLRVEDPQPGASYFVAWGDGAVDEEASSPSWTHRYGDEGARTARVTARFPDGRTATAEVVVRVGAAPPPELTALQRAFAPERQDLTFGVLGLALTLVGGGFAVLARRRRHGRLHEELRLLEGIRERGRREPEAALRALGAYRERLLRDVGAQRLDDAQLHTLDARADVVFHALRTRLLGPLAGRLGADFRHALDVVLHDGVVEPDELAALRALLEAERGLPDEERARLAALLARLAEPA